MHSGGLVGIGGFIVRGNSPRKIVVRAIGPSLQSNNQPVNGRLADPTLELHDDSGLIASNDNWKDSQQSEIEATKLAPNDDRESAIVRTLAPGAYTGIVRGKDDSSGIALVEAYDVTDSDDGSLANISTRGSVETGDNVMIGGFIAGGQNGSTRVVVRGLGPSMRNRLLNTLADPFLELRDENGTQLASNDNWRDKQEADIQASGLAPGSDAESAILIDLAPGKYTALLRGQNGGTGIGLVEIYNLR